MANTTVRENRIRREHDNFTERRYDLDAPILEHDQQPNPLPFERDEVEEALGGNGIPGIQTGGHTVDGAPDTRGILEKAADAITRDDRDDKTGKRVR